MVEWEYVDDIDSEGYIADSYPVGGGGACKAAGVCITFGKTLVYGKV